MPTAASPFTVPGETRVDGLPDGGLPDGGPLTWGARRGGARRGGARRGGARPAGADGGGVRSRLGLLAASVAIDLRAAPWRVWVNSIGGHPALPRVLRWFVYRTGGLDVRTANVYPGCVWVARDTVIGADTFVNRGCLFEGAGPLRIGAGCQVAMEAMFLTSTHPWEADGTFSRRPRNLATTVGDRCWIGARAVILPGVTVGDGCVIGAGAVVTSDCRPRSLYAGVPARFVRSLEGPRR
jgi:maltose O-acetyltransferase